MKRVIVLCLLTSGCFISPVDPTPVRTEKQAHIVALVGQYAAVLGVTVDEVRFYDQSPQVPYLDSKGVTQHTNAAGWVECPKTDGNVINFYNPCVEGTVCPAEYADAVAAHETCHIFYKENEWPCSADEWRATVCGDGVMHGKKP